jgi:hypothetical protein
MTGKVEPPMAGVEHGRQGRVSHGRGRAPLPWPGRRGRVPLPMAGRVESPMAGVELRSQWPAGSSSPMT